MWPSPRMSGRWSRAKRPWKRRGNTQASFFGRQQRSQTGKGLKVLRRGKRDERPPSGETNVGDRIHFLFFQPNDARVFKAPLFLFRTFIWLQRWLWLDMPIRLAVLASSNRKMREPPHILDTHQEQCLVTHPCGGRVKNRIGWIRPLACCQDWIVLVAPKQATC